jgi:hypothetical protein
MPNVSLVRMHNPTCNGDTPGGTHTQIIPFGAASGGHRADQVADHIGGDARAWCW